MKNIWYFLVWKYQRSTRGDLFFYSSVVSFILSIVSLVARNELLVYIFSGYCILVFFTNWVYWTYIMFFRREYEEFKKERSELFDIIKTGKR